MFTRILRAASRRGRPTSPRRPARVRYLRARTTSGVPSAPSSVSLRRRIEAPRPDVVQRREEPVLLLHGGGEQAILVLAIGPNLMVSPAIVAAPLMRLQPPLPETRPSADISRTGLQAMDDAAYVLGEPAPGRRRNVITRGEGGGCPCEREDAQGDRNRTMAPTPARTTWRNCADPSGRSVLARTSRPQRQHTVAIRQRSRFSMMPPPVRHRMTFIGGEASALDTTEEKR